MPDAKPPKRRSNAFEKRVFRQEELALFAKEAGRKAQKRQEPNDRRYDSEFQRRLRKKWKSLIIDRFASEEDHE